jgi:hypothetical protein
MKLQSLSSVEKAIGGRPESSGLKHRHSFYLNEEESLALKQYVDCKDVTVSQLIRKLIKPIVGIGT